MRFSIWFHYRWSDNREGLEKIFRKVLFLVVTLLVGNLTWGKELPEVISGLVSAVHDGDTITVMSEDGQEYRIRFQAIDAPEQGQSGGWQSKWFLARLIAGKIVSVEVEKKDPFGRCVGRIFLNIGEGCEEFSGDVALKLLDVEKVMVAQGHAWHYTYFNKETALATAEKEARREKRGVWSEEKPIPPWKYRSLKKGK